MVNLTEGGLGPLGIKKIGRTFGGARNRSREWVARLGGALVVSLVPWAVSWATSGSHLSEYDYVVLRDGDPIGTHVVTVDPNGRDLKVESKTDVAVKFGILTLFHMEHQRSEIWHDGELEKLTAHTDKNGDIYDISITRDADGYKRVINGRMDWFGPSVKVLTLWHNDLFKYHSFLSPMDDKTYKISVDYLGTDKVDLLNKSVEAFVYRMSGDTNRELWYDSEGRVMKVRLLDHGSTIDYVLTSIAGEPLDALDAQRSGPGPHPPITKLAARK